MCEIYWLVMKNVCFVSQEKNNANSCNKQLFRYFQVTNLPKTTMKFFISFNFLPKQAVYCLLLSSSVL